MTNRDHVSNAELVGRLGQDPKLQYTATDQTPFVKFSVATSERFTDKGADIRERTEWHNAVAWGQTAEGIARDFVKGDSVILTGSLRVNSYEKDGLKNRVTELQVESAQKNLDNTPSRNATRLIGELREDPKTIPLDSGTQMTTLGVATRTTVPTKDGSREREDWHSVTLWGKAAEAARDLKAGDTIAINGTLRHRNVPGQDGGERKLSAIDCQKFQVLDRTPERQLEVRQPRKGVGRGM